MANIKKGMQFHQCKSEIENLAQNGVETQQKILGKVAFDSCSISPQTKTNLISLNKLNNCISKINNSPYVYNFNIDSIDDADSGKHEEIGYIDAFYFDVGSKYYPEDYEGYGNKTKTFNLDIGDIKHLYIQGQVFAYKGSDYRCSWRFTGLVVTLNETINGETKTYYLYKDIDDNNENKDLIIDKLHNKGRRYVLPLLINRFEVKDNASYSLTVSFSNLVHYVDPSGYNQGILEFFYSKQNPKAIIPEAVLPQ